MFDGAMILHVPHCSRSFGQHAAPGMMCAVHGKLVHELYKESVRERIHHSLMYLSPVSY